MLVQYGLGEEEAHSLTLERHLADYYEEVATRCGNPRAASNFVLNDLQRRQKEAKRAPSDIPLPAIDLARLIALVDNGTVSSSTARRELFDDLYESGRPPDELVRERGLQLVADETLLERWVRDSLRAAPDQLARYRAGNEALFEFFVGQVMGASGGRADPAKVRALLAEALQN
jgi:aspartyl-tRNA(Asn)/glutamyl-tRNA(Gln) amidotransferase subunit B